jgi:hypothetical protein
MKDTYDRRFEVSEHYPWLRAIEDVGSNLGGVHGFVLSSEIVAVARPDVEGYSRDAIRQMISEKSWSALARRLCADKVLVRLAFQSDEADAETDFVRCIESLETEYFDYIHEITPGIMAAFLLKGELTQTDPAHDEAGGDGDSHHDPDSPDDSGCEA